MNTVTFQGKLVKLPERRHTVDNKVLASFSIAVPKKFPKDNQTADFFDCVAWGKPAENILKFFKQGDTILIKGRIENDNYTNREGQLVKGQLVIVEEWYFGPKKREDNKYGG